MQNYPAVDRLIHSWRTDATSLRERYHNEQLAAVYEDRARELEIAIHEESERTLNLREASEFSGYSVAQLGRRVRLGQIPNVGRPGAPRVRAGDLPLKRAGLRAERAKITLLRRRIVSAVINSEGGNDGN